MQNPQFDLFIRVPQWGLGEFDLRNGKQCKRDHEEVQCTCSAKSDDTICLFRRLQFRLQIGENVGSKYPLHIRKTAILLVFAFKILYIEMSLYPAYGRGH